jgi:predicted transcriptional regulator
MIQKITQVVLDAETSDILDKICKEEDRSRSSMIRQLIKKEVTGGNI